MNIEKLLNTIIEAGKMLVESGAEVNRVEETMVRMCRCFEGIEYADSYVTLTGIMFSLTYDNQTMTRICRVHTGEVDLNRIDQIVDIIEQNMNNATKKYKVQVNFKVNHHYPPVFNNEELFYALYKNNLVNKLESPVLISEDFGYYRNVAPSIFFFLGTGDTIPLHSNKFTFDEDILYKGVELYRKLLTTKIPF